MNNPPYHVPYHMGQAYCP